MNDAKIIDLVMLVPGKDEREIFEGLLSSRQESLDIRNVRHEILVHPRRDPGCFHEAPQILQSYQNIVQYSLVVLDYEGSGQEHRSPDNVEDDLQKRLDHSGWGDRTEVLVLRPEIESWVWSDSPEVDNAVGWKGRNPFLRDWLAKQGWWRQGSRKPSRSKESLEAALKEVRMRRSSAIYRQLAENVSLSRCRDEQFRRFRKIIKRWFPVSVPE